MYIILPVEKRISAAAKQKKVIKKFLLENNVGPCVFSNEAGLHGSYLSKYLGAKDGTIRLITQDAANKFVKASKKYNKSINLSDLGY